MALTQIWKITKFRKNWNEYIVWSWDISWPSSSTNWHLVVFDWTTWKLIKDWWAVPSTSDCVKTSWTQTINWTKTFSTSPVVPSKTTDAANSWTAIATEAQVYKKQNTLVSWTNIKTINNTSILWSWNISILEWDPAVKVFDIDTTSQETIASSFQAMIDWLYWSSLWLDWHKVPIINLNLKKYCFWWEDWRWNLYFNCELGYQQRSSYWWISLWEVMRISMNRTQSNSWEYNSYEITSTWWFLSTNPNKTWSSFTPTVNNHPATKKYVDDWLSWKQWTLSTQTAYTSKWSATKVPQITTNTLWQVTEITEVDIQAGETYNAWQWISIGDISMNARKWPCPEWWHVPSTSEWSFIETVLFNLWVVAREYSSGWRHTAIGYLHIPMAWYRSNTWIGNDGSSIELRASDWFVDFWDISDESDPDISVISRIGHSVGWWIRPFKDTYEAPTSSWTVIVWSLWSNWVFYNQAEWLISVSNWQTWYTMSDKNLWATVVYNNWDTINEANSWYFYQFWNNHWFPWVGNSSTVTVSTTAVDITWYWPNNYYNSDTFVWIVWSQSQEMQWWTWDWSDLWWSVSWTISQDNVISNTWVLSVNGQSGNITIQTGGEQNLFIITEDMVTVSTSEDKWVAPYSTSYKYTNFDINANAGIEWKEWAIYTFVVNTEMVVASAYRNVRVRIWSWAYIPVMWTTAAAAGNSYFAKTSIRQFQYTTKYESGWALHVFTDSNTTYKAMTAAQATAWTSTTALTISPSILKWAIETHETVKSGDSWTSYTIKVSTAAPASWTSNNVITFVTD